MNSDSDSRSTESLPATGSGFVKLLQDDRRLRVLDELLILEYASVTADDIAARTALDRDAVDDALEALRTVDIITVDDTLTPAEYTLNNERDEIESLVDIHQHLLPRADDLPE